MKLVHALIWLLIAELGLIIAMLSSMGAHL
jgi:hypothetical protein